MKGIFKETKYIVEYYVKSVFNMEGQEIPITRVFYNEKEAKAFFETMINEGDDIPHEKQEHLFEEKTYYTVNKYMSI